MNPEETEQNFSRFNSGSTEFMNEPAHKSKETTATFGPEINKIMTLDNSIDEDVTEIDPNLFMQNTEESLRGNAWLLSIRLPSLTNDKSEKLA